MSTSGMSICYWFSPIQSITWHLPSRGSPAFRPVFFLVALTHPVLSSKQKMRRRVWMLAIGLAAALAVWFAVRAVENWRFQTELRQAQRDLSARRFGSAGVRLARLAQRWPGRGEVEYSLGECEMARGHAEAAIAAWGRVPDQAPEAPIAALSRGRAAMGTGRYGLAETCLDRALRMGGDPANEARRLLAHLHWITGRHDEYRSFLRRELDHTRDPVETLRLLWALDHEPHPIEGVRRELEKAASMAPDDDRVWLAQADLATRCGQPRRGRRFAHAVRAGTPRRLRGLARPARMGPGRRPA